MSDRKLRFKVYRQDPDAGEREGRLEEFTIPWWEGIKVLDGLRYIQACQIPLEEDMVVEPVPRFRLIRDLVVEFGEKMESSEYAQNEFRE